jgi:hypothetical protein
MRLGGVAEVALALAKLSRKGSARTELPRRKKDRRVVELVWKDIE